MSIIIAFVLGFALGNNIDKLCERKNLPATIINMIFCILGIGFYVYLLGQDKLPMIQELSVFAIAIALLVISYAAHD